MNRVLKTSAVSAIVIGGLSLCSSASATNLDCTNGCDQVSSFGATWSTDEVAPAGTGNIDSFVQVQANGTEQGYNTTVNGVFDNKSSDNFNHELSLSEVPIKTIGGVDYREFLLDVNESLNASDRYISLDGLQLYLSDTPNQSTTNVSSLGSLVYDLDASANNATLLDNAFIGSGSGASDLFVYIPNSLFVSAAGNVSMSDPYVYLWSQFGLTGVLNDQNFASSDFGTSAGFEEWAVRPVSGSPGTQSVPEPTSMALLGGAGILGAIRSRRARAAK